MYPDEVVIKGYPKEPEPERERALIVGIERGGESWPLKSSLEELRRLAYTAGADVVAETTQKLSRPNPATFVGSGKAEEIRLICDAENIDLVIFDDELTPTQQSNLERSVSRNVKIIDRTALILDIFALHAKTKEGKLQVRLAQNQYLYPRLRGMWAHLASNRMGGGVGSRFGEGESQLEVDRRIVRKRITSIKKELETLSKVRKQQRESRYSSGIFKISFVGYTNAGKSSLLNALTDAGVYSDDLLFATLDSTTRKLILPEGREVTLTDTVGFIQKLPTTLVEAFKSTLDEIIGADLIIHVVDVSSDLYQRQIDSVVEVLDQIKVNQTPQLLVFNKADLIDEQILTSMKKRYENAYFVSAVNKEGLDRLIKAIGKSASAKDSLLSVLVPFNRGELTALAHRRCNIISESYTDAGTEMTIRVPNELIDSFRPYSIGS